MRQHLEAMIAADQVLGVSYEEAVEKAIAAFGKPDTIGRRVRRESGMRPPLAHHPVMEGACHFLVAVLPAFSILCALLLVFFFRGDADFLANLGHIAAVFSVVFPVFGGWVIGRKASPRHLVRDLLAVPLVGTLLAIPVALMCSAVSHPEILRPNLVEMALWFPQALVASFVSYMLCRRPEGPLLQR